MKRDKRLIWLVAPAIIAIAIVAGVLITRQTTDPISEPRQMAPPATAKTNSPPQPPLSEREKQTLSRQDNTPVAKVNGRNIPHWMFDNALRDRTKNQQSSETDLTKTRKEILQNLIDMELLATEANRLGLTVGQAGGMLRLSIVERSFKSPEAFNETLAKAGMTRLQYADIWRQQATVNRLVAEKIGAQVSVTEKELKQMYEEEKDRFEASDETLSLERIRPRLSDAIRKAKTKVALDRYLANLRSNATIEIFAD